MKVIESIKEMQAWAEEKRRQGQSIGFVPTMGFLHQGHLSLIRASKKDCQATVVSVFVNPAQFSPDEDLQAYPRDFDKDQELCRQEGVDVVFFPSEKEMYSQPLTEVKVKQLSEGLCGQNRPHHFSGVALACNKLFNAVKPHKAFFGLKDFQQYVVVKKLVQDLNLDLGVVACPLVREEDGLALSSRNQYLSQQERREATSIFKGLQAAQKIFSAGETKAEKLVQVARQELEKTSGEIDYLSIVGAERLEEVSTVKKGDVILVAVHFGKARLIDNLVFS